jgi:hypothetical protein
LASRSWPTAVRLAPAAAARLSGCVARPARLRQGTRCARRAALPRAGSDALAPRTFPSRPTFARRCTELRSHLRARGKTPAGGRAALIDRLQKCLIEARRPYCAARNPALRSQPRSRLTPPARARAASRTRRTRRCRSPRGRMSRITPRCVARAPKAQSAAVGRRALACPTRTTPQIALSGR